MVLTYSVPQLGEGVQHVRNVCLAKNQKKSETRLSTVGRLIEVKRTAFITIQKNIVRVSSRDLLDVFQCLRETSRTTAIYLTGLPQTGRIKRAVCCCDTGRV